jgi:hypothetical protein
MYENTVYPCCLPDLDPVKIKDSTTAKVAITDKTGQFTFENIAPGKYILSVSHIGYSNWYSQPLELSASKPSLSVNTILLKPSDVSLDQVTVVGKRPLIETCLFQHTIQFQKRMDR